jgi:hypothetical protein
LGAIEDGYAADLEPGAGLLRNGPIECKFGCAAKLGAHQSRSLTIGFALRVGWGKKIVSLGFTWGLNHGIVALWIGIARRTAK